MNRITLLKPRRLALGILLALAAAAVPARFAWAETGDDPVALKFELELQTMTLTGPPLLLPIGPGWSNVASQVQITLSSQRAIPGPATLGEACAIAGFPAAGDSAQTECDFLPLNPINPAELDGEFFRVHSFFDVFFDVQVTDVDALNDIAGMPDGASIQFNDNGPAQMSSFYDRVFDPAAPNYGLIPPSSSAPYIGHFNVEIPLGADLNGNGENDKIKFTLAQHSVDGEQATFIILPDGTVIDNFDSAAYLEGAIVDESADPPFTIGALDPSSGLPDPSAFGGPVSASSSLVNGVVPEPSSWLLAGLGALGLGTVVRRRRAA